MKERLKKRNAVAVDIAKLRECIQSERTLADISKIIGKCPSYFRLRKDPVNISQKDLETICVVLRRTPDEFIVTKEPVAEPPKPVEPQKPEKDYEDMSLDKLYKLIAENTEATKHLSELVECILNELI